MFAEKMEEKIDGTDFLDNEFCTAILQILKIPVPDSSLEYDMDEVRREFAQNGYHPDENEIKPRLPLAKITSKLNKIAKKKLKMEKIQRYNHCRFCENNEEPPHVFNSHNLRDSSGKLTCPRLRKYVCPICGAKGDNAHTVRYCNKKPIYVMQGGKCDLLKSRFAFSHNQAIRI